MCEGLREVLTEIQRIKDYTIFPFSFPVFQDNWISGKVYGIEEYEELKIRYFKIKFCPFCGFEYEENKE